MLIVAFGCIAHFRGVLPEGYGVIVGVGILACSYQWVASLYLAYAVERGFQPARVRFYLNAVVELIVPTVMIWIAANYVSPAQALTSPASYSYFLFIILSALRLDFGICLFTGICAALIYGVTVSAHWPDIKATSSEPSLQLAFAFFMRSVMFALGGLVAGLVSIRIRKSLVETIQSTRERERVLALFGQHLSPKIVDLLLSRPEAAASDQRTVCVLVLDVRNFTGFTETHSPADVVALLNKLWEFMIRAVNEHHGFINKFLGDGFLAVFGAPVPVGNDCQNAMNAARRIVREFDELIAAGVLPPIQVGIAIHSGEAIVGTVGSPDRREYTVIGDVVNVAFRMEALNKDFGSRLLISESVRKQIDLQTAQPATSIHLRGRSQMVEVYPV